MTQPLPKELELTAEMIQFPGTMRTYDTTGTPAASGTFSTATEPMLPGEKPKRKPGRKPGSKNKPKRAKSPKAPKTEAPVEPVTKTDSPIQSLRIAAGGEGMLSRVRRITADQWVWILIPVAAIALAVALAFLTGAVKP